MSLFLSGSRRVASWLLLRRAAHCAGRRRHDRVIHLCNRALELAPCNAWAYALRGYALCATGKLESAFDDCNEALRLRPTLGYAFHARGVAHYRWGRLDAALTDFDAAVRASPRVAIYRADRGSARRELNDLQGALTDLLQAYKLNSSSALIRLELAKCYFFSGEDTRALYLLRTVLRQDPTLAAAYYFRALIHARRRHYASAATDFDAAARLEPRWSQIYLDRALNHLRAGRAQEALADTDRAWQISVSADVLIVRSDIWAALGNHIRALADLDEAIRLNPQSPSAHGNRALIHAKVRNLDQALADNERAIELEPKCAVFYNNRGFIRQTRGEFQLALADYESAMRLEPEHPNAYKNMAMLRSTCRDPEFRDGEQAIALAEKAIEISLYSEPAWYAIMANAQAEAGHFPAAVDWLRKAGEPPPLSVEPVFPEESPRQFTLNGLLYVTTTIAAVLGVSRWIGIGEPAIDPERVEDGVIEAIVCILLVVGIAVLFMRAYRVSAGKRRAFCGGTACALPVGFCLLAWSSIASRLPVWNELAHSIETPQRSWSWWAGACKELKHVISALGIDAALALVLYVPLGGVLGIALHCAEKWLRFLRPASPATPQTRANSSPR